MSQLVIYCRICESYKLVAGEPDEGVTDSVKVITKEEAVAYKLQGVPSRAAQCKKCWTVLLHQAAGHEAWFPPYSYTAT